MINVSKLLESKRVEVTFAEIKIDKDFVKRFRLENHLTQIALANILGVKKKTIEKWEQGANNINGSSAVLLKLLNDNPELLGQLYTVKVAAGKVEEEKYEPIDCKVVKVSTKLQKHASSLPFPIAAIMMGW